MKSTLTKFILLTGLCMTTAISDAEEVTIENNAVKLTVDSVGGRITSFVLNDTKKDVATKGAKSPWQGFAKERVLANGNKSLITSSFTLKKVAGNTISATATTPYSITKTYSLLNDSAAVKVSVVVKRAPKGAVFTIHNFLSTFNVKKSKGYVYSIDNNAKQFKPAGDGFIKTPNAQWFMTQTNNIGIATHFDQTKPAELSAYLASVATMEWSYAPIKNNGELRYSYTIYLFNPKKKASIPSFVKKGKPSSTTGNKSSKVTTAVSKVTPLITEMPTLSPRKSGYAFVSNIEQIAYIAKNTPSMIHFAPINKSHQPDLFLALPKGIKVLDAFRGLQLVPQGEQTIKGELFNVTRVMTIPSSSKYTLIWEATKEFTGKELKGYFWGEWGNKKQRKKALTIELVSIPKVTPFKKIPVWLCIPSDLTAIWPKMSTLKTSGINYLDAWTYMRQNGTDTWGERVLDDTIKRTNTSGMQLITWVREWWWADGKKDTNGSAMDIDGNRVNQLCLSYRGKFYKEFIDQGKRLIDKGCYQHSTDPEMYHLGEKICFCPICVANFKKFLAKSYPKLKYKNPIKFEHKQKKYQALHNAWNDFKATRYTDFFREYRQAMETYMKSKDIKKKFTFYVMSTYHRNWKNFYGFKNYKESSVYLKTLEDPKKFAEVFDVIAPMSYMDIYANYSNYDMLLPWKECYSLRKLVGKKAIIAPLLSSGYAFISAYDSDTSAEMLKANILESFIGGAKGFGFWGECPFDAKDMKIVAEVVQMLKPYENVILDGTLSDEVNVVSNNAFAKRIVSGQGSLILVSEYSKRDITATINCPVKKSSQVINLLTQKVIGIITPDNAQFTVKINSERAVMLYVGEKQ